MSHNGRRFYPKKKGLDLNEEGEIIMSSKKLWNNFYKEGKYAMWYPGEPEIKFFSRESKQRDLEGQKGLDLGCGVGRHTFLMADFLMEAYGVDISKDAIFSANCENMERNADIFEKNKIIFGQFDGKIIPFKNNFFDYVVCNGVLDHMILSEADKLMKEIRRVLKKDGCAIIAIHSIYDSHYMKGKKIEENTYVINWGDVEVGLPQHYFSEEEIDDLIEQNNFLLLRTYLHEDRAFLTHPIVVSTRQDSMWILEIQKI